MKAVTIDRYGSSEVLNYSDAPNPSLGQDQILVKIHAVSVNPIDWKIRAGMLQFIPGGAFPRILGSDLAGEVVEVRGQTDYQPGDEVYGTLNPIKGGGYAQFAAIPSRAIALKPPTLSYSEAAAIPTAGITALQALRDKGNLKTGHHVLINGASGGVGTFAVQIAKAMGATVTAVCSQSNFDLVTRLGANRAIDYHDTDFTQEPIRYDVIFDAAGKRTFSDCKSALTPNGAYVTTLPNPDVIFYSILTVLLPGQTCKTILVQPNHDDLMVLNQLLDDGKLQVIIDRTYSLPEVSEAHRYSETEHVTGKIVMTVT
ncbi:MAG TPA: NAD(P)-dependent alcohol dehydrogenase [Elainellaceae cyanobacterium]